MYTPLLALTYKPRAESEQQNPGTNHNSKKNHKNEGNHNKGYQQILLANHYLTLISSLVSEAGVFELGDFPVITLFAFTSVCFTFDKMVFDCF